MKHVTIKDIARSLCISVSTVSRAFTVDKNIRKETREMWWKRQSDSATSAIRWR